MPIPQDIGTGSAADQGSIAPGRVSLTDAPIRVIRVAVLILANAILRISGGASAVLVSLYLSEAAGRNAAVDATLVGLVGAVSFGAELVGSVPMGILSDAFAPRWLMTGGALLGATATQLFGLTSNSGVFFLSRGLEGLGAAAGGPALLAHLTDVTEGMPARRARLMSFYEISFLAGIALGGLLGSQLWRLLQGRAFAAVAGFYLLSAAMFYFGARGSHSFGGGAALPGFTRALRQPYLQRLAPVWLCINAIAGLWLGPTVTFLMTRSPRDGQFLAGVFADQPDLVGWMLLWYAVVFGVGVTAWSVVMPSVGAGRALRIGLLAMPAVCVGLFVLNHSGNASSTHRWAIGGATAFLVMVESGFTPAALSLLAGAVGAHAGRGAAMGIYSVLLSIGAIVGSLLAAVLGQQYSMDGLIYGTFGLAIVAIAMAFRLESDQETPKEIVA